MLKSLLFLLAFYVVLIQGSCPGICQPNSYSCPVAYESGLCPGASNIECCRESTPNCPGQCQIDSLSCSTGYKTGLCPGGNDIKCCPTSSGGGSGNHGTDVSQLISTSSWSCLKGKGYTFAVVRAFQSTGNPDPNAPASVANAHSAGLSPVDVYMFPCPKCSASATSQVDSALSYLSDHNVKYGKFWLDIEGSQYWSASASTNQAFFNQLVSAAHAKGATVGVYTSASQWNPIMGSSFQGGKSLPLWYAHYDNSPSFSDFSPFGGWTKPAMKQYQGDQTVCSVGVDLDWYP